MQEPPEGSITQITLLFALSLSKGEAGAKASGPPTRSNLTG